MIALLLALLVLAPSASPTPQIAWDARFGLPDNAAKLAHARDYIEVYGDTGGVDRLLQAHVVAGDIEWAHSCKAASMLGACVRVLDASKSTVCPGEARHIAVANRDARAVRRAAVHLSAAQALRPAATRDASTEERRADLALATRTLQDLASLPEYERLLDAAIPSELSLAVESWKKDVGIPKWERQHRAQQAAFDDALDRVTAYLASARANVAPLAGRDPVLAHARLGLALAVFRGRLIAANPQPPRNLLHGRDRQYLAAMTGLHCEGLQTVTAPLLEASTAAYAACMDPATGARRATAVTDVCDAELAYTNRETPHRNLEVFATAGFADDSLIRYGVQTTLEGAPRAAPVPMEGGATRPRASAVMAPTTVATLPEAWIRRPSSARYRTGSVTARGALTAKQVAPIVQSRVHEVMPCRVRVPGCASISMTLVVDGDGSVTSVGADASGRDIARCLRQHAKRWRFPKVQADPTVPLRSIVTIDDRSRCRQRR